MMSARLWLIGVISCVAAFLITMWLTDREHAPLTINEPSTVATHVFRGDAFNADANWNDIDSTTVLIGSYSIEGRGNNRFVWIGSSAKVTLWPKQRITGLRVAGFIPFSAHHEQNGLPTLSLDVRVNGTSVGKVEGSRDEGFDQSFNSAGIPSNEEGSYRVEFIPNDVVLAKADERRLSVILTKVELRY